LFFDHAAYFNTKILPRLECGWPDAYARLHLVYQPEWTIENPREPSTAFDFPSHPAQNRSSSLKANSTSGGVTASTEMLAAKRHAGVHTPVIACKMIIANQQMAYAA